MSMRVFKSAILSLLICLGASDVVTAESANPQVVMDTSMGEIVVELFPEESPVTVANFLEYTDEGFYDETIFHRVKAWFVVQGGGVTEFYERKETRPAIVNESENGLRNDRGTVAMARYADPDSATSQFFFNVEDNNELDARRNRAGYTVFGKVVKGMDVVDAISEVETGAAEGFANLPVDTILVKSVRRVGAPAKAKQSKIGIESFKPLER